MKLAPVTFIRQSTATSVRMMQEMTRGHSLTDRFMLPPLTPGSSEHVLNEYKRWASKSHRIKKVDQGRADAKSSTIFSFLHWQYYVSYFVCVASCSVRSSR